MKFTKILNELHGQLGGEIGGEVFDIYLDFAWPTPKLRKTAEKIVNNKFTLDKIKPNSDDIDNIIVKVKIPKLNKEYKSVRLFDLKRILSSVLTKLDEKSFKILKKQIVDFMLKKPNKTITAGNVGSKNNPKWDAQLTAKQLRPKGPFILAIAKGLVSISKDEIEKGY